MRAFVKFVSPVCFALAVLAAPPASGTIRRHQFLPDQQRPGQGRRSRRHCGRRPALPVAGAGRRRGQQDLARLPLDAGSRRPAGGERQGPHRQGAWQNAKGAVVAKDVADLHSAGNNLTKQTALSEKGEVINGVGDTPNRHDVLTGSQPDGTAFAAGDDRTCKNWTSSTQGAAMVGHSDRMGLRDDEASKSWNSSHPSRGPDGGCSQADLKSTGGDGLFYCFAAN